MSTTKRLKWDTTEANLIAPLSLLGRSSLRSAAYNHEQSSHLTDDWTIHDVHAASTTSWPSPGHHHEIQYFAKLLLIHNNSKNSSRFSHNLPHLGRGVPLVSQELIILHEVLVHSSVVRVRILLLIHQPYPGRETSAGQGNPRSHFTSIHANQEVNTWRRPRTAWSKIAPNVCVAIATLGVWMTLTLTLREQKSLKCWGRIKSLRLYWNFVAT